MNSRLDTALREATRNTLPGTAERAQALARVRWVLVATDGRFVSVDEKAHVSLTKHISQAAVFNGQDNEETKARFMESLLAERLRVVLLDQTNPTG